MLVYGDRCETAAPGERLDGLRRELAQIAAMPAGIGRHGRLVGALIDAGQLLQGVADAGGSEGELTDLVFALAGAAVRSWDSRFADPVELPRVPVLDLPSSVVLREPEGFAFYAVYPEAYADAARRLRLCASPRVIGIRSIGTTLGATVAAAIGAPPPITVRPFGDPFARQVNLRPEAIDQSAHYVIVDEGPGLSGSSFGCVADALEAHGVPQDRIAFIPSHCGDLGPHASDAHRRRWSRAQRIVGEFDSNWLSDLLGPLESFSTGHPWERRKYRAMLDGRPALVKFCGIGSTGEGKLAMARALHAGGFTAEPIAFVHGFLVERWYDDATPLAADEKPIEAIGRYIGARARLFPAGEESGASIAELLAMCHRNIGLALGERHCRALQRFDVNALEGRARRIRTDNKLDREEWLRAADGRLIKTDALDHHRAHDLIGCQPLEWDVAGAIVEFDLDDEEARRLIAATGFAVDPSVLDFFRVAYTAFKLGAAQLASESVAGAVAMRLQRSADRYRRSLGHLLHQHACATDAAEILG